MYNLEYMFTAQTIGRQFVLDLTQLAEHVSNTYGIKITQPLGDALKGDVNVNFILETDAGKKIIRIYGAYGDYTEKELQVMRYLVDSGFPTSQPLHNAQDQLVSH